MNIMINRSRKLALLAAVAVAGMVPAAAQAHCCRSSNAEPPAFHHHHHYVAYHERAYDVELAPNLFAVPYRLRHFPYVHPQCLDGCGSGAPIVFERNVVVEDGDAYRETGEARAIRAEAEVTILGPDRMIIRLFRKGRGRIPLD
jgi:hypothetical protein